jgi:hypothetical protein
MSEILKNLIKLVSESTGLNQDVLNRNTRISSDLGIDGDDVLELIEAINIRYPLNFDGFVFENYFTPESEINTFKSLFNYFSKKIPSHNYEVTLGDIENWIKNGYWSEDKL